jgi:hypothetical protein
MRLALLLLAACAFGFDHSPFDQLLKQYANTAGEVDYSALRKDSRLLDQYVAAIAQSGPATHPQLFPKREDQVAYWINAYNALMINAVVKSGQAKSVRNMGLLFSVFRRREHTVGGRLMSLDDIEHDTLRKQLRENRIHFALVCASVSCPGLSRDAFLPEKLEAQLEAAARAFFADSRNYAVDEKQKVIRLSKILDWYGSDFGAPVLEYVKRWLPAPPPALRVTFNSYNWNLNGPGSRGGK